MSFFLRTIGIVLMAFFWIARVPQGHSAEHAADTRAPNAVVESYLRATYARDFSAAYALISAEDRKLRDLDRYLRQRGPYNGFVLEAARKLGEFIEVRVLSASEKDGRRRMTVRYRVPDPQKIAPLVLQWEPRRLNSLAVAERRRIVDALERYGRDGYLAMSEGEESFDLVQESGAWRIFLNWAAGVTIPLRLDLAKAGELDVSLSRDNFILQPGDIFEVRLKIKNRAPQPLTVRIGHLVEPQTVADFLDFVQCGFLLPVTLQAGKEQEYSGTYMLRGSLPEGVHQLSLTYDFRLLK
jgi:hypothetical protein